MILFMQFLFQSDFYITAINLIQLSFDMVISDIFIVLTCENDIDLLCNKQVYQCCVNMAMFSLLSMFFKGINSHQLTILTIGLVNSQKGTSDQPAVVLTQ